MRKPFLRYCAVVPARQSHRTGGRLNNANRLAKIVADKGDLGRSPQTAATAGQFQNEDSAGARDIL